MSLKTFHVIFISVSVMLAFGFAYWCYVQYSTSNNVGYLITAVVSAVIAVALTAYEIFFIRKTRSLS